MPDRIRDIELYQNEGALITLGATQIISFTNFDTSTSATVTFDDSTPNNGAWNAGEAATIGGDPATLLGTGLSYAGVKVTILGITLANIQLSTPVRTALLDVDGSQMLHFYNADGSEADPAALLDALATQLVTALSGTIPPLLRPAVNAILANPLQFVQNNALLTMNLTPGGTVPFVPCFTAGTMIMTRKGEVAVEDLHAGDEVLISNGAATESFYLGPVGMSAMSASDRLEIIALFPDLCTEEAHHVMPPARKFLVGHIAKSIVARAIKNTSPVVEPRRYTSA